MLQSYKDTQIKNFKIICYLSHKRYIYYTINAYVCQIQNQLIVKG